ncbi:MAG TPA: hypothetical protein VG604_01010 [Candidatus Saccharimonadales bacterium]|nr:hypothetical protein [Candidatus Saccharimonadales bacterium]
MAKNDNSNSDAEKITVSVKPASAPTTPSPVAPSSDAVVAEDYKPSKMVSSSLLTGIIAFVVIGVVIGLLVHSATQPALEFSAFGKTIKVSQDDYRTLSKQAKGRGVKSAATIKSTIEKAKSYQLVAEYLGTTPTDNAVEASSLTAAKVASASKLNDWDKLNGYIASTDNAVKAEQVPGYEGTLLYYPYDSLFVHDGNSPKPAHFGDAKAVAANKAYALKLATADQKALESGKTKADVVLKRITADPKLHFGAGTNNSYSFKFDFIGVNLDANPTEGIPTQIPNFVRSSVYSFGNNPGVSGVYQLSTTVGQGDEAPGFPRTTTIAYYVVVFQKFDQGKPGFQQKFNADLKQVKVTSHVK